MPSYKPKRKNFLSSRSVFIPASSAVESKEAYTSQGYYDQDDYAPEPVVVKPKRVEDRLPGIKLLRRLEQLRLEEARNRYD